MVEAFKIMRRNKPAAIVGFGGYPTLPPLFAAWLRGVPIVVHEQNAVLGRANAVIAKRARLIATSFANTDGIPDSPRAIVMHVGNPVRANVIAAARKPYREPKANQVFELLVFGGSQGARVFADLGPVPWSSSAKRYAGRYMSPNSAALKISSECARLMKPLVFRVISARSLSICLNGWRGRSS